MVKNLVFSQNGKRASEKRMLFSLAAFPSWSKPKKRRVENHAISTGFFSVLELDFSGLAWAKQCPVPSRGEGTDATPFTDKEI